MESERHGVVETTTIGIWHCEPWVSAEASEWVELGFIADGRLVRRR